MSFQISLKRAVAILLAVTALLAWLTPAPAAAAVNDTGWVGEYFTNMSLAGSPLLVRVDSAIDFNWGAGSPDPRIAPDRFSARWSRYVYMDAGRYQFTVEADDGVRLWVDGALVIDRWQDQPPTTYVAQRDLSAGTHSLRVEYYENLGGALIRFWSQKIDTAPGTSDWLGEYYNNMALAGLPVLTRHDAAISFNWGLGSPAPGVVSYDTFSVRWTRLVNFAAGQYRFTAQADDGVRVYLDDALIIDGWRDQQATTYMADRTLTAGNHTLRVEYYENTGAAVIFFWWQPLTPAPTFPQWRGEYYTNPDLAGLPALVRNDPEINFHWGAGSPDPTIPANGFSVRWTRTMSFASGRYRFTLKVDDGVRLWVDGLLFVDEWHDGSNQVYNAGVPLSAGNHTVMVEYYERNGDAWIELSWSQVNVPGGGNLITCAKVGNSWIKAYQRLSDGTWLDINPHGWGPIDSTGFMKIDALPVDYYTYGAAGNPYRIELWVNGTLTRSVGNTSAGQPEFRIRPDADNYTPWQCPVY